MKVGTERREKCIGFGKFNINGKWVANGIKGRE